MVHETRVLSGIALNKARASRIRPARVYSWSKERMRLSWLRLFLRSLMREAAPMVATLALVMEWTPGGRTAFREMGSCGFLLVDFLYRGWWEGLGITGEDEVQSRKGGMSLRCYPTSFPIFCDGCKHW